MKKKIVIILVILILVTVAYAADVKWTALAELTTVADVDVLCIVDDPGGTPASKKITVLNLFDTIDTFAELNTIVADKTLVNEEDAVAWDALGTFGLGITITTGDPFTLGTNRIDNGSDLLDGEMIGADTIDDDSLDFADITGIDLTLTDCGAITSTGTITATVGFDIVGAADIDYGSVDVLDHTFITDSTGDAEIVLPNDSIGDAEIDWSGLTTSADFTVTGTLLATVGIDGVGAVDLDYGSVDITDHTFVTDGTGTAEIVLPVGSIDGTEILDDTLDSPDYAAGSIDEEHLNATNAPGAGEDNYVLTYNHAGLNFTWAADATGGNTAWDDIGNPDANDTIDMGAYIIGLDVNDFRVGAVDAGNYMKIAGNAMTFVGTADIDLPNDSVDSGDINFNYATSGSEGGSAASGDSATAFFSAGTIEHEYGGLEADVSSYTGLVAISGGSTAEIDSKSELEGQIADVADFAEADGDIWTGNHDFGGADLELPQGQTPDTDGDIDLDFTDGSVVIQHGSAHAELGAATDVVVGKLIGSFSATFATPDGLQSEIDQWPLKPIESSEFPHGIVITDIYLKTSASSTYAINVENWDDPTTINAANGTIDAITTSSSTEVHEDTITYSTIGAGQIIMLDLPTTDVSWFTITIEYYEPIS